LAQGIEFARPAGSEDKLTNPHWFLQGGQLFDALWRLHPIHLLPEQLWIR